MKTIHLTFFRNAAAFLTLLLFLAAGSLAQTPQYYNYATGGNANMFPLNTPGGKMVQWLVAPGEFNTPTGARTGNITSFYCRIATGYPLNSTTYTTFKLIFGQTTLTSLPSGVFYTGTMDTVFKRATVTLQAAADTWLKFTLDHSFAYDSTKSLVIQMEQCLAPGVTGYSLAHTNLSGNRRAWSVGGCPFAFYGNGVNVLNCGIDVTPPPPPTPPYYNTTAGTGTNTYPFGQSGGQRVHWLIRPGTLNQPSSAPPGNINALYFWMGSAATTTFTNITVQLCQQSETSLPTRWYTSELDTVYFRASVTLSSVNNGWMLIPLDNPFPYDTSKGLVVDIQQCAATSSSMWVRQSSGTPFTRNYGTPGTGCPINYVGQDGQIINFGVNIVNFVGIPITRNTVPSTYVLEQNYPNPFNPVTTISYSVPKAGNVRIALFDLLGREVAVLLNEFRTPGSYNVEFNASELSSGVYFYRMEAGYFRDVKKMMLIK